MSTAKRALLWIMGIFYLLAGIMHFVRPHAYLPMMPPYLPWHLALIYLSGVAEVLVGAGVLIPSIQRIAAWATILLLIAIFPANVHIALYNVPLFGWEEGFGTGNWIRLPFQGVLILWAWWYT